MRNGNLTVDVINNMLDPGLKQLLKAKRKHPTRDSNPQPPDLSYRSLARYHLQIVSGAFACSRKEPVLTAPAGPGIIR